MTYLEMLTDRYRELMAAEPPQDAGGHPAAGVHERVGEAWADWDRQHAGLRMLITGYLWVEYLRDEGLL